MKRSRVASHPRRCHACTTHPPWLPSANPTCTPCLSLHLDKFMNRQATRADSLSPGTTTAATHCTPPGTRAPRHLVPTSEPFLVRPDQDQQGRHRLFKAAPGQLSVFILFPPMPHKERAADSANPPAATLQLDSQATAGCQANQPAHTQLCRTLAASRVQLALRYCNPKGASMPPPGLHPNQPPSPRHPARSSTTPVLWQGLGMGCARALEIYVRRCHQAYSEAPAATEEGRGTSGYTALQEQSAATQ